MVLPFRLSWTVAQFSLRRRHWAKAVLSLGVGWLAVGATCGVSVALCRPLDTPGYLIPYYLRDVRARFNHYASSRTRRGGPKCMTVEDFARAVLATKDPKEPIDTYALENLTRLFAALDANGDTYLSLSEFSFLMLLLSSRQEEMQTLFAFLDEQNVGSLNMEQFTGVLRGIGCDAAEAEAMTKNKRNGIMHKLFGADGKGRCGYTELAEVIESIHLAVWETEFRQFDKDHNDRISAESFGQLIANQMIGSHVPFYIVDNIRRMHGNGETMTLDMWISFHRVMRHADAITEAVELYTSSGLPLARGDFNRAVKAAGLKPFAEGELDLIMAVFDRNGDGVLQFDEFMSVMKQKLSYHIREVPESKKSLPKRLVECVGEAIAGS